MLLQIALPEAMLLLDSDPHSDLFRLAAPHNMVDRIASKGKLSKSLGRKLFQRLIDGVSYCHNKVKPETESMFPRFMRWDIGALVTRIRGLDLSIPGKFEVRIERMKSLEYEREILATDEQEVGRRDDGVNDVVVGARDGMQRVTHEVVHAVGVKGKDVGSVVRDAVDEVGGVKELENALKCMADMELKNKAYEGTISKLEDEVVSLKSKMEMQAVNIVGGFGCVVKVKDDEIRKLENENKELRKTISIRCGQCSVADVNLTDLDVEVFQNKGEGIPNSFVRNLKNKARKELRLEDYDYQIVGEHEKKTVTYGCKAIGAGKTLYVPIVDVDTGGVAASKWSGFDLNNRFGVWKMMTYEEKEKIMKAYERNGDRAVMWASSESGVAVYFTDVKSLVRGESICGNSVFKSGNNQAIESYVLKNFGASKECRRVSFVMKRSLRRDGIDEVDECRGVLRVYSDGSIVRSSKPSFNVPVHDNGSVIWKDVQFDSINNLHLRLYKPATSSSAKLPIFFYIHGGGFCIGSRTWPNCQNYCFRLALDLQALIISPDYRLAPENRLPAAIEDGYMAVKWLTLQAQAKSDPWLSDVADFSRVFISGDSSWGNIAHSLTVRLGAGSGELDPVRVRGYVLLAPFFGGTVLTRSEAEGPKEAFLNWELIDRFWRLSISIGETTDYPLVNPFGPVSPNLESKDLDPMLVVVGGSDLLRDRVEDYARKLKGWGKKVEYVEFEGKQHGFFTIDPNSPDSDQLMLIIKRFITEK
ncbi:putative carboxylesterase 15 [Camellia lanceoleosa]|uniref:Carboxylesterase 15 n=1 Tax=Camellia lanceoleosa TaxID=1840588 RepID=A0ACC0FX65_9ERIC|nr:putative carboxylesterase 15 [Camellia lanceoleosa]